ncbi:Gfo/Idh/MocA family oxidoreductase [Corynebacterium glutamicum]|uniref:Gfo/Idh/MocA family oxidoreductase n=1 Tax=Corynebacterium glutamicum TaxID=1718 RepID=UPI003B5CCD13
MTIRIGLVGYGVGGRLFHTPYIQASTHCELVGVVARSESTKAAVAEDLPDVAIVGSLTELLELGVDAVVISTPPATRRELALEAINAGVAVVADKPFAPSAADAMELVEAAEKAGVLLNVFHNRRNDTHIVTALGIQEELGAMRGLDLRLDLIEPDSLEAGPEGGLLRDLGSHVVDQTLVLMGPATSVTAQLGSIDLPEGPTNARFRIVLEHESGAISHISASKIDRLESWEIRLVGERGSYVSNYTDVQTVAIKQGLRPINDREHWGYESEERWGTLVTDEGSKVIPSAQGDYTRFYDAFALAVENGGAGPVPAREGVAVLKVLDAVAQSAAEKRTIELS